ncbi:MAG: hypothetical protein Q9195_008632 [Heterodermia aff. obscurata]
MTNSSYETPVLDTYHAVVLAFGDFLTVAIHTILYERDIYPRTSFLSARKYNYAVKQSRHPKVCKWIQDAVAAVQTEMLKDGSKAPDASLLLSRSIVSISGATDNKMAKTKSPRTPMEIRVLSLYVPECDDGPTPAEIKVVQERYVFSTTSFPRLLPSEHLTPFDLSSNPPISPNPPPDPQPASTSTTAHPQPQNPPPQTLLKRFNPPPASDLPEQFRATIARLSTLSGILGPLPADCGFTLAIELRDELGVDPPIGHPQPWIAAEPGLQRERGAGKVDDGSGDVAGSGKGENESWEGEGKAGSKKGKDLGGVKTTPVRSLEAGAFVMEVWVEEGKGKFDEQVGEKEVDRQA